ncbi:MAG: hypothetical protein ACRCWG_16840 [Sarcina sp.]
MHFKNKVKCSLISSLLVSAIATTVYSSELELNIKDNFVNMIEYVDLIGAEQEIKEIKIHGTEEVENKYIIKLKTNIKDELNILELFEDGRGIYINGKYVPFEETEVNGFKAPKMTKIINEEGMVKVPVAFFEDYLGARIKEEKLIINKMPNINIGNIGEYNDLKEIPAPNEKLKDIIEEDNELDEEIEIEKPKLEVEKPKPEVEKPKPEIEKPKPEVEKPKPEVEKPKPEVEKPKPEVEKPKPEVEKPKPEVEEPKPEVEEPKPEVEEGLPAPPNVNNDENEVIE